ncbi:MAG: ribosomal RNA small subunit methyltransferase A [bacterium]
MDRDLVAFLSERFAAPLASGQLRLVPGDAAKVDWPTLLPGAGWICAANLPYNVGTGILTAMVDLPGTFRRLVLMLQREVARRVVAGAGDEARGSLSVYVEARAEARVAIKVPPGCFFPAPKVHSAVLQIDLLAAPRTGAVAPALLEAVCLGAFAQPRKALRKSLRARWPGEAVDAALEAAGVHPLARPADLDLPAWLRVAAALGWTGVQAPG